MRRAWALVLVTAAAGGYATASTFVVTAADRPTSYAAADGRAMALTLVAGWSLVLAGTWATWVRTSSLGPVTLLLGVTWWAPVWVGDWAHAPVMSNVAALLGPFAPALLLHLALVAPAGTLGRGRPRRILVAAYAATTVYVLARAAIRDPFLDRYCWNDCSTNVFLLHADPQAARALDVTWTGVTVLLSLAATAITVRRLLVSSPVGRRLLGPVLVPVALAALAVAAQAIAVLSRPAEDPRAAPFLALYLARAAAYALLACGVGWAVLRVQRAETALGHLAQEWDGASSPVPLEERLAAVLGDPTAQVAFRIDDERGYVDGEGRPWPRPASGRLLTPVVRAGEEVAVVATDPALTMTPALLARTGDTARMVIDNERLRAGLLADLAELHASRARIVTLADRTRHRLERDLHDGAQQRLLALGYELRMAADSAAAAGDPSGADLLERAYGVARSAAEALRELAQGIYPAVLSDNGIDAALRSIAATSPTPVRVVDAPDGRFSPTVERAVYLVVSAAVQASSERQLTVSAGRAGDAVVVSVRPVRENPDPDLVERVTAVDGRVELRGETLWAEVPCG